MFSAHRTKDVRLCKTHKGNVRLMITGSKVKDRLVVQTTKPIPNSLFGDVYIQRRLRQLVGRFVANSSRLSPCRHSHYFFWNRAGRVPLQTLDWTFISKAGLSLRARV